MSESEAMPMIIHTSEFMLRAVKGGAEMTARLVAFFIAWKRSRPTSRAEESMRRLLQACHETGADVVIGKIGQEHRGDFRAYAKEYGLQYHVAHKYEDGGIDFMFLDSDMNKLSAVSDRLGLKPDDFNLSLFQVTEMRESIKRKLDSYEKEQRANGAARGRSDTGREYAEEWEDTIPTPEHSRAAVRHQVSEMGTDPHRDVYGAQLPIQDRKMPLTKHKRFSQTREGGAPVFVYEPKREKEW